MNFVQDLKCARNVVIDAFPLHADFYNTLNELKLKARWHCLSRAKYTNIFAVVSRTGVMATGL